MEKLFCFMLSWNLLVFVPIFLLKARISKKTVFLDDSACSVIFYIMKRIKNGRK